MAHRVAVLLLFLLPFFIRIGSLVSIIFINLLVLRLHIISRLQVLLVKLLILSHLLSSGSVEESTSLDLRIQVQLPLNVAFEDRDSFESETEPLREESLDALNIACKVELCISMRGRHHLREINDCDLFVLADHQVKLIEITVDESMLSKSDDKLDQLMVDLLSVGKAFDVDHRVCLHQAHHNTVAVGINRGRRREVTLVERFHEGVLFERGDAGHVEPALGSAILQIISVVFDRAERSTTKPSKFNNDGLSLVHEFPVIILLIATLADINIGLFAHTNLAYDFFDMTTLHKNTKCQIVITHVCKCIATIVFASMKHTFMLQKVIHDFKRI